jgi:hypothetical protein
VPASPEDAAEGNAESNGFRTNRLHQAFTLRVADLL